MSHAALTFTSVSFSYGPKSVLRDVSFTLTSRSRLGILGRNGTGKSTLLRLATGQLTPEAGRIERSPGSAAVGYLTQEPERRPGETVLAFLRRRTGVEAAEKDFLAATNALGTDSSTAAAERYDVALTRYLDAGVADFDARVGAALDDLGLGADTAQRSMTELSGGQAAKANLASIVLSTFDIILLDEPTNDLDFAGLDRLERFITAEAGGVAIVSHDRSFLARVTNTMLELDAHSHGAAEYRGGYEAFLRERELAAEHAQQRYAEYTTKRDNLAGRAQQQRQWSDQGVSKAEKSGETDKFIRNHNVATSEKQASKARATQQAMERLDVVDKPFEAWRLELSFGRAPRSGDVVAALTDAVIERGDFRLGPLTETVSFGERIALVGPNGSGKTTFLRALLGHLPLTGGAHYLGPGVVIGEIDQRRGYLEATETETLTDAFMAATGWLREETRTLLAKFDLGADHVSRRVHELSPGERTRATMAVLMARETNCLVLDEPTNHLDIEAIEQLETALDAFDGTVLVVTHDRALLERLRITRTLTFAG